MPFSHGDTVNIPALLEGIAAPVSDSVADCLSAFLYEVGDPFSHHDRRSIRICARYDRHERSVADAEAINFVYATGAVSYGVGVISQAHPARARSMPDAPYRRPEKLRQCVVVLDQELYFKAVRNNRMYQPG